MLESEGGAWTPTTLADAAGALELEGATEDEGLMDVVEGFTEVVEVVEGLMEVVEGFTEVVEVVEGFSDVVAFAEVGFAEVEVGAADVAGGVPAS